MSTFQVCSLETETTLETYFCGIRITHELYTLTWSNSSYVFLTSTKLGCEQSKSQINFIPNLAGTSWGCNAKTFWTAILVLIFLQLNIVHLYRERILQMPSLILIFNKILLCILLLELWNQLPFHSYQCLWIWYLLRNVNLEKVYLKNLDNPFLPTHWNLDCLPTVCLHIMLLLLDYGWKCNGAQYDNRRKF